MQIFICWSSGRGHKLAETLHRWLPEVVPGLDEPFLSSEIEAGTRWSEKVAAALHASDAGLVCLTPEGVDSPWIYFEAGALTLAVKGVLYTYSHNVPAERVPGPLSAFQASTTTRDSTLHMVKSISRRACGEGEVDEAALAARFDRSWPTLARVVAGLGAITIESAVPGFRDVFISKTFTEPMPECHDRSWTGRLERLARVDAVLQRARERVSALEEPHLMWLYDQLLEQIGRYLMNIRSVVLLTNNQQQIRAPDVPRELMEACERPRLRILQLRQQLLDPASAPVLADAARFQALDTPQRKEAAQVYERRVATGELPVPADDRRRALDSFWDLDRMVSYQCLELEATTPAQMLELAQHARRELERAEVRTYAASLMPLYCAVRALEAAVRRVRGASELVRGGDAVRTVLEVAEDLHRFISADPDRDATGKFARRIDAMKVSLGAAPAA